MRIRSMALSAVFLCFAAWAGTSQAVSFQGKWNSNQGTLFLYQTGQHVEGTYAGKSGTLSGKVTGNRLEGHYFWTGKKGSFELVLNPTGTAFKGKWVRGSRGGSWTGSKVGNLAGKPGVNSAKKPAAPHSLDFSGNWQVEGARNGKNRDYHPVPWTFSRNGTVHAGNIWRGLWERKSADRIRIILIDRKANTDQFDVSFTAGGTEFIAYKNGSHYRYGKKM